MRTTHAGAKAGWRTRALVALAVVAVMASLLAASPTGAAPAVPPVTYATGALNGQNGWDGGIVSGNPVPFTNDNPGSNVVQDAIAHSGSQSWLFGGSYGSPGAGTPFTPVVATVGAPNATDFGSPITPAGDQSVVSMAFKPTVAGDGSGFNVYEGSYARDDRTGANLNIWDNTDNGNPPGTVSVFAYELDSATCGFLPVSIAEVSNDEWHTVTMTTTYPEIVDGDYSTMGSTVYVIDEGTDEEVTSDPVVSWMHPYREAPACNVNSNYAPGSSLKFRNLTNDYPAHQGFAIDDLSMTVRNTTSDTTVATFSTGFEATLNVPGAPTALTATESASTVDVAWTAPLDEGDSPITGYTVYRDGTPIGTTDAETTSFQDTTATASSQAHTYKVTAESALGSSADSNTDTAIVDLSWKGQVWDVVNGTAVVNGEGGVDMTRLGSGESSLHLVGDAPINGDGTPWVRFDYQDDGTSWQGIDLFIDSEENPGDDPRISAGSLFSCDSLGYARHSIPAVEEIVYPEDDQACVGPRPATGHSLYVGQRSDGTVDYQVDGDWHSTTFLKDFTGAFAFNDILLRWRCGTTTPAPWVVPCAGGETITFDDFAMGADHDEDPPVVTITTPPDGVTYYNGLEVPADYACADASGIASCTGDVPDGEPIDTSTDGEHEFTVTGVDNQGQETSVTHTYDVLTPAPALTLTKAVDEPTAVAGATLHYHLTVTNAGNVPLTGLGIVDPNAPTCAGPIANLAVGASTTVDCTYATTTGDVGTRANAAAVTSAEYAFALSNIVTTTVTPALPGAPTGLTATEDASAVDVAWAAPASNGGSPITGYEVYRDDVLIHTTDGSTLSYQDTGATASSAAHTYKVRAKNVAGAGPASNSDTAIVDLTWKGEVWDVLNGTAVVNGDGGVDFTRLGAGQSWLHMVGTPDINDDGTPWVEFSYTDDGTSYQGIDMFIDSLRVPDDPRLQAGSLFACGALGYARYNVPEFEQIVYPEDDQACVGPRPAEAHSVYAGERSDGTVDYIADGDLYTTTFLKDATGPFAFNDVILRWRCGAGQQQPWVVPCTGGETVTFDDFTMGDDHDAVGPHITINTPVDGAVYELDDEVLADFTCVDDTAVSSCEGNVADGDPIDTSTEGEHDFTVTAEDEDGHETTLTHTYTVIVPDPALAVEKSADEESVLLGETIHYHLAVENTGNVDLHDVDVTDVAAPDCGDDPLFDLAVGASVVVDCAYTPDGTDVGDYPNTAQVDSDRTEPATSNEVIVEVEARAPAITLEKSATEATVAAGSPIHYQLTATNTGNVPLTGIGIIDGNAPACAGPVTDLAVGDDVTVNCTYTPSNGDVGTRVNVAAVTTAEFATALSNVVGTTVTPAPGHAEGTVTEAGSGDPLADVWVLALRTDDYGVAGGDVTDEDGDFDLTAPPDTYYLYLVDPAGGHTAGFFGAPQEVVVPSGASVGVDPTMTPSRGTVEGTVTEAGSGDPLAGMWAVAIGTTPFGPEQFVTTDGSGDYVPGPLAAGAHYVGWVDPTGAHAPRFFPDSPSVPGSTTVDVTPGEATDIDGSLPVTSASPGGSTLTGTVTESGTDVPLAGVHVVALNAANFAIARGTVTDANGEYSLDVAAGDYKLEFVPSDGRHSTEWHEDLGITEIEDAVTVSAPGVVDADLDPLTGSIAGTVTDEASGDPLAGAWVLALGANGPAGGGVVGLDGSYVLSDLPAGTYRMVFIDATGAHAVEYWDDHPGFEGSDALLVTGGGTVTADAALGV